MDPKGVPWSLLGVIWNPLGDFLGSLDVLLAAVGSLGGPFGIPGVSWGPWAPLGRFQGFSGKFREAFWFHFEVMFGVFSLFVWGLFF